MRDDVSIRELVLAALLFVCAAIVVAGVAMVYMPAAWITAGVLGAAWSLTVFGDVT